MSVNNSILFQHKMSLKGRSCLVDNPMPWSEDWQYD